jgi:hypothetical protein
LKLKLTAVVCLCSLVSILCFAIYGYAGTDYSYHLSSWMDYSAAWKSGVPYPAWAARANFGLGEPRFFFYPPISLWFGSILFLILPLKIVPAAYTWLTFCLAGFSMYRLSSLFLPEQDRLKAAALYCLSYFPLITASKHFAIAELLTDAFLPIICFFFLKVLFQEQVGAFVGLTIGLALACQTDVPAAIDIAYTLFLGASIFLLKKRKARAFFMYAGAQALALLLSAWYLLPAFLTKREIGADSYLAYDFRYLFARTTSALLDETLSVLATISLLILIFCLYRLRQSPRRADGLRLLIYLGFIAFFFQLPFTRRLWDHLPELRIVGFPFRFQIFLAIALPLAVLALRPVMKLRTWVFLLYAIFAVLPLLSYWIWVRAHGAFPPIREYARSLDGGSIGMLEYAPAGTGGIALLDAEQQPRIGLVSSTEIGCLASVEKWLPESKQIEVTAPAPCTYHLRLYYFPFWHLFMDGKTLPASFDNTGLIVFSLPPGKHRIEARFDRPSGPLLAGTAVACVVLLLLAGLLLRERRRSLASDLTTGGLCAGA